MPVDQKAKYVHITLDKAYRLEQLIDEFFEIHGITHTNDNANKNAHRPILYAGADDR